MKLEEIETKIAALKARKADLETKTIRLPGGSWEGDVMAAEAAVEKELGRLSALRAKALAGVEEEAPAQAARVVPKLRTAFDFEADEKDFPDPILELNHLPDDEPSLKEVYDKLVGLCTAQVNAVRSAFRKSKSNLEKGGYDVRYTQVDHLAITWAIASVHAKARYMFALGRDARNDLEKKLLARIEALEARPDMKYLGVWSQEKIYGSGNFVTEGGSVWHAQRASVGEKPGAGDAWMLAVKKGKDMR